MCYQLEQLLVHLQSNLLYLKEEHDNDFHNKYIYGQVSITEDIIEKVKSMLVTSKCKGNHLG